MIIRDYLHATEDLDPSSPEFLVRISQIQETLDGCWFIEGIDPRNSERDARWHRGLFHFGAKFGELDTGIFVATHGSYGAEFVVGGGMRKVSPNGSTPHIAMWKTDDRWLILTDLEPVEFLTTRSVRDHIA